MQAPPSTVSCFKCGKTGHWSRDCTVPPSEWIRKAVPPARPRQQEAAETPRPAALSQRQDAAGPSSGRYGSTPAPGTAARSAPKGQGCFKCGKTGHWSRDCTAPPSEQLPRTPFVPNDGASNAAGIEHHRASDPVTPAQPRKTNSRKHRKRKIRIEDLKEKDAIAEVFHKFPERFARQFKGKGHELSDLRRLLEMYKNWQQKFFPFHDFDEAMHQIADLGRSNRLKMELREMRQGVLKIMEDAESEAAKKAASSAEAAAAAEDGAQGADEEAEAMEDAEPAAEWDEDDELVDLQQQGWEEAEAAFMELLDAHLRDPKGQATDAQPMDIDNGQTAEPAWLHGVADDGAPAQQQGTLGSQVSPEDEELLALAIAPMSELQDAAPQVWDTAQELGRGHSQVSPEDEELLALALAPSSQPEPAMPRDESAGQPEQALSQISPEDEELLALATAPLSQPQTSHVPADESTAELALRKSQVSLEDAELLASATDPLPQPERSLEEGSAGPAQGLSQVDPEDEELLALAGATLSQPVGSTSMARSAAQANLAAPAQPDKAASQLIPEDEKLLALACAPLSQPRSQSPGTPAHAFAQQEQQQQDGNREAGSGSQASQGDQELINSKHAISDQLSAVPAPLEAAGGGNAEVGGAEQNPRLEQQPADAETGVHRQAEAVIFVKLADKSGLSESHAQGTGRGSQPSTGCGNKRTEHEAAIGKENAADMANSIEASGQLAGRLAKQPLTALEGIRDEATALTDITDEDAELLALL